MNTIIIRNEDGTIAETFTYESREAASIAYDHIVRRGTYALTNSVELRDMFGIRAATPQP